MDSSKLGAAGATYLTRAGYAVCRHVRTFSDRYILMLTARGSKIDRVVGLSVGADDYITKPFSARELVAPVQAVLRRPRTATRCGANR